MPVFTLLGLFVGSFLNVCIDRLPRGQSIINPPSHCPACNHKLGILDLVPLFSYLWLRGRCRYCHAPIPLKLPIVEGVTGLLFAFFWPGLGMISPFPAGTLGRLLSSLAGGVLGLAFMALPFIIYRRGMGMG